jgi:hypothetical protein
MKDMFFMIIQALWNKAGIKALKTFMSSSVAGVPLQG